MDIVATFIRSVPKWWRSSFDKFTPYKIAVRLFIECKYIDQTVVFWDVDSHDNEINKAIFSKNKAIKYLCSNNIESPLFEQLSAVHHFQNKRIIWNHDQEWSDLVYKAITQSLHSLIYYDWDKRFTEGSKYIINYPVVVTKKFDSFFDSSTSPIHDNFLYYMKNYNYPNWSNDFLVDFVSFNWLEEFLVWLEIEIEKMGEAFYRYSSFEARR